MLHTGWLSTTDCSSSFSPPLRKVLSPLLSLLDRSPSTYTQPCLPIPPPFPTFILSSCTEGHSPSLFHERCLVVEPQGFNIPINVPFAYGPCCHNQLTLVCQTLPLFHCLYRTSSLEVFMCTLYIHLINPV